MTKVQRVQSNWNLKELRVRFYSPEYQVKNCPHLNLTASLESVYAKTCLRSTQQAHSPSKPHVPLGPESASKAAPAQEPPLPAPGQLSARSPFLSQLTWWSLPLAWGSSQGFYFKTLVWFAVKRILKSTWLLLLETGNKSRATPACEISREVSGPLDVLDA